MPDTEFTIREVRPTERGNVTVTFVTRDLKVGVVTVPTEHSSEEDIRAAILLAIHNRNVRRAGLR